MMDINLESHKGVCILLSLNNRTKQTLENEIKSRPVNYKYHYTVHYTTQTYIYEFHICKLWDVVNIDLYWDMYKNHYKEHWWKASPNIIDLTDIIFWTYNHNNFIQHKQKFRYVLDCIMYQPNGQGYLKALDSFNHTKTKLSY